MECSRAIDYNPFIPVPGGELPQDAGSSIGSPEATIRPAFFIWSLR
jgi:hypothetical protein